MDKRKSISFFKWKESHLDERQLLIHGKIFKHALVSTFVLLFLNSLYIEYFGHRLFVGMWDNAIMLAIAVAIINIEMIYYEIYPIGELRN